MHHMLFSTQARQCLLARPSNKQKKFSGYALIMDFFFSFNTIYCLGL
jgi:hypothetical protein